MISTPMRPVIPAVISQHAEESAILRHMRSVLVRAPHVKLLHLARLDERIAAHLDGLAVAGEAGRALCMAALETPATGEVFAAAVRAIEERDEAGLEKLFAVALAVPESRPGLISAFDGLNGPGSNCFPPRVTRRAVGQTRAGSNTRADTDNGVSSCNIAACGGVA